MQFQGRVLSIVSSVFNPAFSPALKPSSATALDLSTTGQLPRVTVVIPVYNVEQYIENALASIAAQNYPMLDIIVVDDGSTDATAQRIFDLRTQMWPAALHYFYQPNRGPAAARNLGIQRSRTDFITFLDADDLWPPGTLLRHVRWLIAHPRAWAAQGRTRIFRIVEQPEEQTTAETVHLPPDPVPVSTSTLSPVPAPRIEWAVPTLTAKLDSALYRRGLFERVGLLDEDMRMAEDLDWFLRVREAGFRIDELPEVAIAYRRHRSNMSNDAAAMDRGRFHAGQKAMQRRRTRNPNPPGTPRQE